MGKTESTLAQQVPSDKEHDQSPQKEQEENPNVEREPMAPECMSFAGSSVSTQVPHSIHHSLYEVKAEPTNRQLESVVDSDASDASCDSDVDDTISDMNVVHARRSGRHTIPCHEYTAHEVSIQSARDIITQGLIQLGEEVFALEETSRPVEDNHDCEEPNVVEAGEFNNGNSSGNTSSRDAYGSIAHSGSGHSELSKQNTNDCHTAA